MLLMAASSGPATEPGCGQASSKYALPLDCVLLMGKFVVCELRLNKAI